MIKTKLISLLILLSAWTSACADQIDFSDGWSEQRFSLFSSNEFEPNGETLHIRSDGTVSMFWSRLPPALWDSTQAVWDWEVISSVPHTDLTVKGGDDRNLSVYFVFMPEASLPKPQAKLTDLLGNTRARVLMYIWGGDHRRGEILPTPYLNELGRSLILRPASTGQARERSTSPPISNAPLGQGQHTSSALPFPPTVMTPTQRLRHASRICASKKRPELPQNRTGAKSGARSSGPLPSASDQTSHHEPRATPAIKSMRLWAEISLGFVPKTLSCASGHG